MQKKNQKWININATSGKNSVNWMFLIADRAVRLGYS